MMNYETFKEEVKENVKEHFQKMGYEDVKIEIRKMEKINCMKDGMEFCFPSIGNVSPVLYISDLYKEFECHNKYHLIIDKMVKSIEDAVNEMEKYVPDLKKMENSTELQSYIVFQIINTRWNEALLKNHPHREFLDLSIVYRLVINVNETNVKSVLITNNMAEKYGFTENELFELAFWNTREFFPYEIVNIRALLSAECEIAYEEIPEEIPMWVITNKQKTYGAANIMYYDALDSTAEKINDDLYLLPSSLHEWIAIPARKYEIEKLIDMVKEINRNCVDIEDRLSDQVYFYKRVEKSLTIAHVTE